MSRTGTSLGELGQIIAEAKRLAVRYRRATGKPLGITGEVAEYEAARILNLELCEARQEGYDAVANSPHGRERLQIKGRCSADGSKTQRVGGIKFAYEWDYVLLVMLDKDFEPLSIHKASRVDLEAALRRRGSRARNERGQLSVKEFQRLALQVWGSQRHSGQS